MNLTGFRSPARGCCSPGNPGMIASMRKTPLTLTLTAAALLLSLLAARLLADDSDKKKEEADKDKKALKGKWEPVSSESGGNKDDESEYKQYRLVFEGDKFTIKKSGEDHMKGKVKLDTSKTPRQVDLEIEECPDPDNKGKSLLGIYEVKEDELKWCFVPPDRGDRPKEFTSQAGTSQIMVTLKREK